MIDCERVLTQIDHLQQYLRELRAILPPTFEAYQEIEKRRACERLLQLAIEAMTDTVTAQTAPARPRNKAPNSSSSFAHNRRAHIPSCQSRCFVVN